MHFHHEKVLTIDERCGGQTERFHLAGSGYTGQGWRAPVNRAFWHPNTPNFFAIQINDSAIGNVGIGKERHAFSRMVPLKGPRAEIVRRSPRSQRNTSIHRIDAVVEPETEEPIAPLPGVILREKVR